MPAVPISAILTQISAVAESGAERAAPMAGSQRVTAAQVAAKEMLRGATCSRTSTSAASSKAAAAASQGGKEKMLIVRLAPPAIPATLHHRRPPTARGGHYLFTAPAVAPLQIAILYPIGPRIATALWAGAAPICFAGFRPALATVARRSPPAMIQYR